MEQKRTLVLGDIHGAKRAFKQVLERCNYNPEEDKLIFLGDYSDGWSETAELVSVLIEIEKEAKYKPVFIKGNHDEWTRDWILYGKGSPSWLVQGGQATFDSYIRTGLSINLEHKKFYENLLPYYIDEYNRGFVHGGFTSKKGLGHELHESVYWWDRDLWSLALTLHNGDSGDVTEQAKRFFKHTEVYIGHTTTENWQVKPHLPEYKKPGQADNGRITVPMHRCNVWNMDTGAGWSGKLSVMDIDTKEYFQSDFVKDLYPNEKGRR